PISRTIGKDQVVDEFILSFTHDTQWDYLLPGILPTGRHVDLPHIVVMKFENGKVAHEHIWWDQASLLVQVGLLDPANLPVAGAEQARKLLGVHKNPARRSREQTLSSISKTPNGADGVEDENEKDNDESRVRDGAQQALKKKNWERASSESALSKSIK